MRGTEPPRSGYSGNEKATAQGTHGERIGTRKRKQAAAAGAGEEQLGILTTLFLHSLGTEK
jgi:hypothetical protein